MAHILTPAEIEDLARQAGKTIKVVCQDAGIAQSTFTRWRSGQTEPQIGVYRRILAAVGIDSDGQAA